MYNRYIPGANGTYQRHTVAERPRPSPDAVEKPPEADACPPTERRENDCGPRRWLPAGLDTGDLLLLCIVILLMIDSDEEDILPVLITAAAFLFL